MSLPDTEGCPRCQDYEKVKDELESNKRKSQEEQKSALKKCEDSKAQLQKKLLTAGAAAIIGGTVLGKEFVDKIAGYIESFNKVKDTATDLVSQANPPAPPEVKPPQKSDDSKEDKKEEEKKEDPRPRSDPDFFAGLGIPEYPDGYPYFQGGSAWDTATEFSLASTTSYLPTADIYSEEIDPLTNWSLGDLVSSMSIEPPLFYGLDYEYIFGDDASSLLTATPPAAIVPEGPAFLTFMAAPLILNRRSRRS